MRRALVLGSCLVACVTPTTDLPPHGEALFVVDTDLPVPTLAGRLRVDVYSEEGRWLESRDIGRSDPRDWPASFSVFSDDDERTRRALVRLRAYPEGSVRPYEGEQGAIRRTFVEPRVASSVEDLCVNAPELPIGGRVTMRQGEAPITEHLVRDECPVRAEAGAVAARVTITTSGAYRFSIAGSSPYVNLATLSLRSSCEDASSQITCRTIVSSHGGLLTPGHFARFDATLAPGTYWVLSTGALPGWIADTTLEVMPLESPIPFVTPAEEAIDRSPQPRLVIDGQDRTPATEPVPSASVDRLVLVELTPGVRGSIRLTMKGACAGTAAVLGEDPGAVTPLTARTCEDEGGETVRVQPARLEPEVHRPAVSVAGTFAPSSEPCPPPQPGAARICIPPGVFLFGSRAVSPVPDGVRRSSPERIAVMPRFWLDRDEVTVGRFRAAVARGLEIDPNGLTGNEGPFPPMSLAAPPSFDRYCTWSTTPVGREDYPMTCIGWRMARAFCRFEGGDLPTEAEWEYAAVAAGRQFESTHPWGEDDPGCARGVFGRLPSELGGSDSCPDAPRGPAPISASNGGDGRLPDVTPQGVAGMAGSVSEWLLDSARSLADDCWQAARLLSPRCFEENAPYRSLRGSAWPTDAAPAVLRRLAPAALTGRAVPGHSVADPTVGLRCAYVDGP